MSAELDVIRRDGLDRRIRDYHGLGVEEVLQAIAYLRDSETSVIAGGSLAFGLGNELSDLDVVITGDSVLDGSRVPLEHFVDTLRIDVWRRGQDQVEEIFEQADRALTSSEPLYGKFGTAEQEADLKLVHRIAFGIQLDGPPVRLRLSRDHREVARDLVVREYVERMRQSVFAAQLGDKAESPLASIMNGRRGVEDALHMVVAARDLPWTGDKWLHERLLRDATDLQVLHEEFAVLPDPENDWRGFVQRAVELCSKLSGLDLAVATLSRSAVWDLGELRIAEVHGESFLVSKEHGGLWELDESDIAAWRALQTAQSADGSDQGEWACADLDSTMMTFCYRLYERGLATLRWTTGVPLGDLLLITGAAQ